MTRPAMQDWVHSEWGVHLPCFEHPAYLQARHFRANDRGLLDDVIEAFFLVVMFVSRWQN